MGRQDEAHTYYTGGGWGDRIAWMNKEQFEQPGTQFKVVGWKPRIPRVGDFLLGRFGKGVARFQFAEVEPTGDPPDMFFATVNFVGYEEE